MNCSVCVSAMSLGHNIQYDDIGVCYIRIQFGILISQPGHAYFSKSTRDICIAFCHCYLSNSIYVTLGPSDSLCVLQCMCVLQ